MRRDNLGLAEYARTVDVSVPDNLVFICRRDNHVQILVAIQIGRVRRRRAKYGVREHMFVGEHRPGQVLPWLKHFTLSRSAGTSPVR